MLANWYKVTSYKQATEHIQCPSQTESCLLQLRKGIVEPCYIPNLKLSYLLQPGPTPPNLSALIKVRLF